MSNRLPERIEPLRLASQGEQLKGTIALSQMQRLVPALTDSAGSADVELRFQKVSGLIKVTGLIRSEVGLICQRCLQPMRFAIDAKVHLGVVRSLEQAERLPDGLEPLLIQEETVSLTELVEDELLLALPVAPVHEIAECPGRDRFVTIEDALHESRSADKEGSGRIPASERPNPFAVLAELKATGLKKK